VTLTTQLSHEQLIDWGWRIPYVFGLLVGPAELYIRSHIDETLDFLKAERSQKVSISDLLRRHPIPLLLALGATIVSASSYYLLLYIPT
jgi:MFS transporter, MHS family, proline/betaine transporter